MDTKKTFLMDQPLELWGGLECTVNRVKDAYFSQMERNGHAVREDDLERFASLGIRAIRYPVLWEHIAPDGLENANWSWPDKRLSGLQKLGVTPIVGLVHHGSGPRSTNLTDPRFADQLASFAGAVAERYPWVEYYTPVNEPLTTARFSGLYGVWYPHGQDDHTFIQALLNQCRAVVLSMRAIREINPAAKLVQTDDINKTYGTPEMEDTVRFFNERRWLSWDLLCGKVDEAHALWDYLTKTGFKKADLLWFRDNPCPPDIIGLNYYITSERWLDHRVERYLDHYQQSYREQNFADIETARVLANPTPGIGPLLQEAWDRYSLPIAITEAHIDASREDQMRWLHEIWHAAQQACQYGVNVRALTVWALLGSFDWNCLVTECKGYYEPGPFDVRSPLPRPTAIAQMMRSISVGRTLTHPVLQGQGWWRRPGRFLAKPVSSSSVATPISRPDATHPSGMKVQPILIIGASGTLGRAFVRICEQRSLAYCIPDRSEMDIANPASVERAIVQYQPWAIVNAAGYVRVDDAENDVENCFRDNMHGPLVLAVMCARYDIQLLTFSTDLVFNGQQQSPYVESDPVSPLSVYGKSKAEAERKVLATHRGALIVRTSSFFGPWDNYNFLTQSLQALAAGRPWVAAHDLTVSPTYVPDLVHACLDLLIDNETGLWHLTNGEAITWADLALKASEIAGIDATTLERLPCGEIGHVALRPLYSALSSERGFLLPTLEDALSRFIALQNVVTRKEDAGQTGTS